MCTHTFHSKGTKRIFVKARFGNKGWNWFNAINDENNVKCFSRWIGKQEFWFCKWKAESEDLIR